MKTKKLSTRSMALLITLFMIIIPLRTLFAAAGDLNFGNTSTSVGIVGNGAGSYSNAIYIDQGESNKVKATIYNIKSSAKINVTVYDNQSKKNIRNINYTYSRTYDGKVASYSISGNTYIQNSLALNTLACGSYRFTVKATERNTITASFTVNVIKKGAYSFARRMYTDLFYTSVPDSALYDALRLSTGELTASALVRRHLPAFKNLPISNQSRVNRLYWAILGRAYDQGGYDYWVACLNSGASLDDVVNGFLNSAEFKSMCANLGIRP